MTQQSRLPDLFPPREKPQSECSPEERLQGGSNGLGESVALLRRYPFAFGSLEEFECATTTMGLVQVSHARNEVEMDVLEARLLGVHHDIRLDTTGNPRERD